MQIVFLPPLSTLVLCIILWPILQFSAAYICLKIPDKFYSPDSFLYRERKWERSGMIYNSIFKVRKWKKILPDGSNAMNTKAIRKKNLKDFSKPGLQIFLIESCRAELTHVLAILPFWIFGFFAPPVIILYMLIYALIFNLPFIIIQRYNRPRIQRLLKKYSVSLLNDH
ncbi:MAG: glycosyl-4,4'-diaponeurosporenoate acyltransferase CrtO family protein [Saccharofermentanales bacterium]